MLTTGSELKVLLGVRAQERTWALGFRVCRFSVLGVMGLLFRFTVMFLIGFWALGVGMRFWVEGSGFAVQSLGSRVRA